MTDDQLMSVKKLVPAFTGCCIAIIFLAISLNTPPATGSDSFAELSNGGSPWLGLSVETKTGRTVGYVSGTRLDEDGSLQLLFVDNISAAETISEPTIIVESSLVERTGDSVVLDLRLVDG